MKKLFLVLATVLVLAASGCAPQVDVEAEAAAIRELTDVEWMEAGQAKDLDRRMSFYTDDALLFPPNAPLVTGKEAIRAVASESLSIPGYEASWQTTKVEVSRSGDLAYSYGPEEITWNDAEGNPVTDRQKWVAVWKKQPDGSWKCAVLIFNSDGPAAAAGTE
jgi:ketosteroid isomerase-like protein